MRKSLRALVVLHEQDEGPAVVGEHLRDHGYELHEHIVTPDYDVANVANPFPSLDGFDLLVLMGSIRSLTRKSEIDSWIYEELDLIRSAQASELPMLGICFGAQLIAEAMGGTVELASDKAVGWYEIHGEANPIGRGPWKEWHDDHFIPPSEAEVLAINENGVQLFRIGRSVGTQFHPEVSASHIRTWTEAAGPEYFEHYGVDCSKVLADAVTHETNSREQSRALIDWFVTEVATD